MLISKIFSICLTFVVLKRFFPLLSSIFFRKTTSTSTKNFIRNPLHKDRFVLSMDATTLHQLLEKIVFASKNETEKIRRCFLRFSGRVTNNFFAFWFGVNRSSLGQFNWTTKIENVRLFQDVVRRTSIGNAIEKRRCSSCRRSRQKCFSRGEKKTKNDENIDKSLTFLLV